MLPANMKFLQKLVENPQTLPALDGDSASAIDAVELAALLDSPLYRAWLKSRDVMLSKAKKDPKQKVSALKAITGWDEEQSKEINFATSWFQASWSDTERVKYMCGSNLSPAMRKSVP